VPPGVHEVFAENVGKRGAAAREAWEQQLAAYRKEFGPLAEALDQMHKRELPPGWDRGLPTFAADSKGLATRDSSAQVLNVLAANVPWLMGGAADLAPSTKTHLKDSGDFSPEQPGARNFHFGIRENAMAAACNGLALSKIRPFGATFLIFSDYLKPAMRLSAIMELPVVYVFTHDSIGVGEDGPTHQPIEQLSTIRATPGLIDFRPADANEVVEGWRVILPLKHEPAAMVLSRQALPTIDRTKYAAASGAQKGAYVLADTPNAKVILIGTGSEVSLCLTAHEQLKKEGIAARVVSMPSWKLFEKQPLEYRQSVLPPAIKARVAVEQAATLGWERYASTVVGMTTFGASAPLKALQSKFGFTVEHVVKCAKEAIA
jgi:transketolase